MVQKPSDLRSTARIYGTKGLKSVTCRHCGTRHVADYREYLLSNIGSQGCLKCGNELISWNGPRDYIEFRLEKE